MGVYKDRLEKGRVGLSTEQIHQAKCARKHQNRLERKARMKLMMAEQEKNKLTPEQQLEKLDFEFGKGEGAKKERKKLLALIN